MKHDYLYREITARIHKVLSSCYEPISAQNLAEICNIKESHASCPKLRSYIRSMIEDDGICIVSNLKGYYFPTDESELQEYLNTLMTRQIALSKRIVGVHAAFHNNR